MEHTREVLHGQGPEFLVDLGEVRFRAIGLVGDARGRAHDPAVGDQEVDMAGLRGDGVVGGLEGAFRGDVAGDGDDGALGSLGGGFL